MIAEKTNEQLYLRIKDEDLIAREFRYHRHCYRNRVLLLSINKTIDLESAISYQLYPLYPIPLSLANPDGSKRSTQKSKLLQIFKAFNNIDYSPEDSSAFIVDFIAQLRVLLTDASGTFEDLIKMFYNTIPKSLQKIDIVVDTYRDTSIKSSEGNKRGKSAKIEIGSVKCKLPADMAKFMLNNDNKSSLINLQTRNLCSENWMLK